MYQNAIFILSASFRQFFFGQKYRLVYSNGWWNRHFYINWWRIATQQELSRRFLVFTKNMATRSTRNYLSIFNYSKLVLLIQFSVLFIPPWLKRSRANFSLRFNFRLCKMEWNWFNDHKNTEFVHRSRLGESLARRKRLSFWKM